MLQNQFQTVWKNSIIYTLKFNYLVRKLAIWIHRGQKQFEFRSSSKHLFSRQTSQNNVMIFVVAWITPVFWGNDVQWA